MQKLWAEEDERAARQQAITDYKPTNTTPQNSNASFPDELNSFYARFDRDNQ